MTIQINPTPGMTADPSVKPNPPPNATAQRGDAEPRTAVSKPPVKEVVAEPTPVNEEELSQSVSQINDFVQTIQRNLEFSVDEDSGRTVVKVINRETDEVIRQYPPEEALAMVSKIREQLEETLLFEAQA